MGDFTRISPIFAVRDLDSAMAHYERLGFATTTQDAQVMLQLATWYTESQVGEAVNWARSDEFSKSCGRPARSGDA